MTIIDLSQPVVDKMPVFPGDAETSLVQTKFLEADYHNNHQLVTSMHSGTHIDAPMHLTESEVYISQWPLNSFMGRGCLLDVRNRPVISAGPDWETIKENSIVLLWTGHDALYGSEEYYNNSPIVDPDFCELLIKKKIKMLGLDAPSPDKFPFPVHKRLLGAGILIMENLTNLGELVGKDFELIAFPLKIQADGAMTRAVARLLD